MRTFKDSQGEVWVLDITVGTLLSIKQETGLDLLDAPGDVPTRLDKFVDVLWVALLKQVRQHGLDETGFAERLDGEALASAIDCFMEELGDFFTSAQKPKGAAIKGVWAQTRAIEDLEAEQVEKMLGVLSTAWQESLESTQPTSDSGS